MHRRRRLPPVVALLLAWLVWPAAEPLAQPQPPRERIGLALGGGAARGFAHIGVLRWLHEHRVPVDFIGGTSIGGLVAGSFATGMDTQEIEALVTELDWATILGPDSPFVDKTFRRKEDARAFPSVLEFGLRGGPHLPTGLSPAVQVNLLFDRIALPYYGLTRFDDLPTPFRCVAVDLRTSDVVVFDSGLLQEALRATMAIPGVFTPVSTGDRVLVDGGVLNNVPADVVLDMGADVVIAVDVGSDLSTPKTSDSIFAVLGETLDVMMRAGTRRAVQSATHLVVPELKGLSGSDFSRVSEFIERGYAGAEATRATLIQYAVSAEAYQHYVESRQARRRREVPAPSFLAVEGVGGYLGAVIRQTLRPHLGKPLDPARLERDLIQLTGSERFDAITYRVSERGGKSGITVTARAKAHAPPYLLGALDLKSAESSGVEATLRGRLVYLDFLLPGSELRLDLGLGSTTQAGAEFFVALGRSGLFLSPQASFDRSSLNVYVDDSLVSQYRRVTRTAAIDAGITTGRRFEARVGYSYSDLLADVTIGDPLLPVIDGPQRHWRVGGRFDGQDSPVLPMRGLRLVGEVRRFLETAPARPTDAGIVIQDPDQFVQAFVDGSYFHPVGQNGRIFLAGSVGSSFGETAAINSFTLGGPFKLGAYRDGQLRGSNATLATVGYFQEMARIFEGALGRLHVGGWVESGATFETLRDARFETNVSGGLIMETPLGPGFLMASVGRNGKHRLYVGIGPLFGR